MIATSTASHLMRNSFQSLVAIFLGIAAIASACFVRGVVPLIFAGCLFLILVSFSRLRLANLVLAYILADHSCQFFKRLIFALGPQSKWVYYGFQVLPTMILAVAAFSAVRELPKAKLPGSAKLFLAYIGVSLSSSLLNWRGMSIEGGLAGFQVQLIELMALVIGMALPLSFLSRVSKLFFYLILISVAYGAYQFFVGPTLVDRVWAIASKDFSMEGYKVYASMFLRDSEFRPFSYYADHTTWGFFLVIASLAVLAAGSARFLPRKRVYTAVGIAFVGMVVCETRVVLFGFLASLAIFYLIKTRQFRRPALLLSSVVIGFAVVVTLGDYVLQHSTVGIYSSALLNRYTTVGTFSARTSAWRTFIKNVPVHWLLGTGYGYANADPTVSLVDESYAHNMFVEALVLNGLPGLFFLLSFFYLWIREAFWTARLSMHSVARIILWIVALSVGMLLTGNVQGLLFMNTYYFLFLGLVSGEFLRVGSARAEAMEAARGFVLRPRVPRVLSPTGAPAK